MLTKSKNLGIAGFFAYFLIFLNTISGFLIGPFLLGKIGESTYGVYTTIFSFASALTMADVGVTQTLIRYIANYKSENKSDEETSILCRTIRLINYIVIGITLLASFGLYFALPSFYSNKFSAEEITTAKNLFIIFSYPDSLSGLPGQGISSILSLFLCRSPAAQKSPIYQLHTKRHKRRRS